MEILVIVLGYLLGAMPFAYLITRWAKGLDIRSLGTGNPGTANVFRTVGLGPAIAVAPLDIGKGAAPVLLARAASLSEGWALAAGVAAVLGHCYSPYLRFRGGGGMSASIGTLLALMPLETAVMLPLLGLVYIVLTGSSTTGTVVGFTTLIGLAWWRGQPTVHILAPLVLMLLMGLRFLPHTIRTWRAAPNKGELICRSLIHKRRTRERHHEQSRRGH
jgi:glycerol-3-phosphate acyltransferase PlsY